MAHWQKNPALTTGPEPLSFHAPHLGAAFSTDYTVEDDPHRLFTIGAGAQWQADDKTFNWDRPLDFPSQVTPDMTSMFYGTRWWEPLVAKFGLEGLRQATLAETMSQFMHGEQLAMLVAAQLAATEPEVDFKMACAQQCHDEARHLEFFRRMVARVGVSHPIGNGLESLGRIAVGDGRTYHKCIALQLVIEGLALASFHVIETGLRISRDAGGGDKILETGLGLVRRDESRHVGLGVHLIKRRLGELSDVDRDEAADFVFEAFGHMRNRLMLDGVCKAAGLEPKEVLADLLSSEGGIRSFHNALSSRVLPQAALLGLAPERLRAKYETEFGVDWAKIEKRAKVVQENDL